MRLAARFKAYLYSMALDIQFHFIYPPQRCLSTLFATRNFFRARQVS